MLKDDGSLDDSFDNAKSVEEIKQEVHQNIVSESDPDPGSDPQEALYIPDSNFEVIED